VVWVLPTVTVTDPIAEVFVKTKSSTLPLLLAFTVSVAEPEAAVAPVSVDSNSALVAVAETVAPAAIPETEILSAFEDVTVSAGTGNAIAVAEVVPPVAETVATVSVCVLADDGAIDSVVAASAITAAIDSFLIEVIVFLSLCWIFAQSYIIQY
jgi:hypothetical protein